MVVNKPNSHKASYKILSAQGQHGQAQVLASQIQLTAQAQTHTLAAQAQPAQAQAQVFKKIYDKGVLYCSHQLVLKDENILVLHILLMHMQNG